jgi:hypothetical protein
MFSKKNKTKQLDDTELLRLCPYCPKCDSDVIRDESELMEMNFCPDCGTKLIQPSYCIWCNNPVNGSAKYCTGCGELMLRKEYHHGK